MLLIPNGTANIGRNFIIDKQKHEMKAIIKKSIILILFFGYLHSRIHLQYISVGDVNQSDFSHKKNLKANMNSHTKKEIRDMPMFLTAASIFLGWWLERIFRQICDNHRELKNLID